MKERLCKLPICPATHELNNTGIDTGDINVKTNCISQPDPTFAIRILTETTGFAYMPDHEVALGSGDFPNEPEWSSVYDIANDVNLLFNKSQY